MKIDRLAFFHSLQQSFLQELDLIDKDFEELLSSSGLKIVAALSTKFFQKRAAGIISAFENVLEIYSEEYERLLLLHYTLMNIEERKNLASLQLKFKQDLKQSLQRLNAKAQVCRENLKENNLELDASTLQKLHTIENITVDQIFEKFKIGET